MNDFLYRVQDDSRPTGHSWRQVLRSRTENRSLSHSRAPRLRLAGMLDCGGLEMKLYAICLWLVAATLVALTTTGLSAAQPSHGVVLEELKELDRPVTYTETKIPLGELIQKVAADTGAKLRAAPDVADEPVAVVV